MVRGASRLHVVDAMTPDAAIRYCRCCLDRKVTVPDPMEGGKPLCDECRQFVTWHAVIRLLAEHWATVRQGDAR